MRDEMMRTYNKLVRDNIPGIIKQNGQKCIVKKLDQPTYEKELRSKLKEEVNEYLEAENDIEAIEELSDVLEIIHSLAEIHGKNFNDIEMARQKKFNARGGFKEKWYLVEADEY